MLWFCAQHIGGTTFNACERIALRAIGRAEATSGTQRAARFRRNAHLPW
ncbi:Uncharacterised protein [Mycobacteroides abscessus subsp. abscessus]|jgi:hypothetical protein|nr:Uncharacterised protein [Mycobacteroides abscessus subsp. abscessus]